MQLEEKAKAMQEQAKGLKNSLVTKVAESVPAKRAASVRVHLSEPALLLQRTSRLVVIERGGKAAVQQEFEFQLTAPSASIEMRVPGHLHSDTPILAVSCIAVHPTW
jgi:hypothetical protein